MHEELEDVAWELKAINKELTISSRRVKQKKKTNRMNSLIQVSSEEESEEEPQQKKTPKPATPVRRPPEPPVHKKSTRSSSSDSSGSTEASTGSSNAVRSTGAPFTTEEVKQRYLSRGSVEQSSETPTRTRVPSTGSNSGKDSTGVKPFQSRFLNKSTTPTTATKEETDTSSEEETESEEESDDNTKKDTNMAKTDIGPLLARSAQARETSSDSTRNSPRSRYSSQKEETPPSKYTSRVRPTVQEDEPRYGYTSRFLNKSKSSAIVPPDEEEHSRYGEDSDSKYPSGRSRYMAMKERRQRLARSKSSHAIGDDDDVDEPISPTSSNPSAYLASRGYGSTASSNDLARSRSSHALKSRENSPDRNTGSEKDGAALSSWARYLKNKYGNRGAGKDKENVGTPSSASSSSTARRLSLGLPLRSSTDLGSSDDDQKNMQGSPTTHTAATVAAAGELTLNY